MVDKNSLLERLNQVICMDNVDSYVHLEADHLIESYINLCEYMNQKLTPEKAQKIQEKMILAFKTKNGQKFQKFFENNILGGKEDA